MRKRLRVLSYLWLTRQRVVRDVNQKLFIFKLVVQNTRPFFPQSPLPTTKPRIIRNGISKE